MALEDLPNSSSWLRKLYICRVLSRVELFASCCVSRLEKWTEPWKDHVLGQCLLMNLRLGHG